MSDLIEDRCLPMLRSASRLDDTDTRIARLQLHLGTVLAELRPAIPEPASRPFCRAYLRFDEELESVRSALEEVHGVLVRNARQCLAALSPEPADRPATMRLRG